MTSHPPERIELPDFVLRRSRVDDAELVADTVAANLDRLAAWMPWALKGSATAEFQRTRLPGVVSGWDLGTQFEYLAVSREDAPGDGSAVMLGTFGLERRIGPGAFELGYWLAEPATGRGYATAAARALTEAALALPGVVRMEIHCDPANVRSRRIPERLGYRLDRIEPAEVTAAAETGQSMIWVYPPNGDDGASPT